MADVTVDLTDAEHRELSGAANRAGVSIEQYAADAIAHAVASRYVLPITQGKVLPFQGLKGAGR